MTTPVPEDYDAQPLLVSVEQVGRRVGIDESASITAEQRQIITDAILDSQANVESFLNRSLFPTDGSLDHAYPADGYDLTDIRAWQPLAMTTYDDVCRVVGTPVANGDGTYQVTLSVGLDAREIRPIQRYVLADASELLRTNPDAGMGARPVTSMSAEGQSLNYGLPRYQPREGLAGGKPNISTLARWKRQPVWRRNRPWRAPWPYDYGLGWQRRTPF